MKKYAIFLPLITLLVFSCKSLLNTTDSNIENSKGSAVKQTVKLPPYQPSETRIFDLINTDLEVAPIWEKQQLEGKAILTLKPYFYDTDSLLLDAKGMEIKQVYLLDTALKASALKYTYDSLVLNISLDKKYTRNDTIIVAVEYVAKPNELTSGGSKAITDDKGLYFINPLGRDKVKPQQLWTQGETEASSCWFPTIDAPNEKTTQSIKIVVDDKFNTLSNGVLVSSKLNKDGTRMDHWVQKKRHAPYLFMMAVGEFAVLKNKWNGIDVNYLVPKKDSAQAESVFGNTPEMLTFYSEVLNYPYPWDKYSQIVVSDYVSGAMENTGAVIHGKWVFTSKEEQIDYNHEDVIAHELFHHWFGDLVTCESWANLPLNESFATYGEFLWMEHKYDQLTADRHLHLDLIRYLRDSTREQLIRFRHNDKEDMFDRHSYEKGGRVLHMLRDYLGDDAFFEGLALYLKNRAFKTAEVHHLRLAFEEVSGQDLNWFFNQWFLDKGHPILHVETNSKSDSLLVTVKQMQGNRFPVFKLPVSIDVYFGGSVQRKSIWIDKREETFLFKGLGGAEAVNFDAKKVLLAEVEQNLSAEEALVLFEKGKNYRTKLDALIAINGDTSAAAWDVLHLASKDTFEHFRKVSYYLWARIDDGKTEEHKERLLNALNSDKSSDVRLACVNTLAKNWSKDSTLISVYKKALQDSSINVQINALMALSELTREDALLRAYELESSRDARVIRTLADFYTDVKDESKRKWYEWAIKQVEAYSKSYVIKKYAQYLNEKGNNFVWNACKALKEEAIYENNKNVRKSAGFALQSLRKRNMKRIADIRADIKDKKTSSRGNSYDLKLLKEKHQELLDHDARLLKLIQEVVDQEMDKEVKQAYIDASFLTTELPKFELDSSAAEDQDIEKAE